MAVEEQEINSLCGSGIVVVGVAVLVEVLGLQAVGHKLACQKHLLLGSGLLDILDVHISGLVHLVGIAVFGIHVGVDIAVPAPPVFVLDKVHELIRLELTQLIGAVGNGGIHAGAVGAGPDRAGGTLGFLQIGVVQIGLDQVLGAHAVGHQIEAFQSVRIDKCQLIVAADEEAHVIKGVVRFVGVADGAGVLEIIAGAGIGAIGAKVVVPQVLGRDIVLIIALLHGGVTYHGIIGDIAPSEPAVGAGNAPEAVHVHGHLVVGAAVCNEVGIGGTGFCEALEHGIAGQGVVLGVDNGVGAAVVVAGTVIKQLRAQAALQGVHEVLGGDGGAVVPLQSIPELDAPCIAGGSALRDVELWMRGFDLLGDVHGEIGRHGRDDHIAIESLAALQRVDLIIEEQGVQTVGGIVKVHGVVFGLVGVWIPAGRQGAGRGIVRICSILCHRHLRILCVFGFFVAARRAFAAGRTSATLIIVSVVPAGCQRHGHGRCHYEG